MENVGVPPSCAVASSTQAPTRTQVSGDQSVSVDLPPCARFKALGRAQYLIAPLSPSLSHISEAPNLFTQLTLILSSPFWSRMLAPWSPVSLLSIHSM